MCVCVCLCVCVCERERIQMISILKRSVHFYQKNYTRDAGIFEPAYSHLLTNQCLRARFKIS